MIFLPMERRGLHPSKTQSKQPSALRTNSLTGFDLWDPACAAKSAPKCEDQHTRLGMFLLFLQIFIELAKLGSDRVSRRRRGPGTHNGRNRATASPPGLQRLFSFVSNGNKTGQRGKYFPSRKTEPDSQVLLGSGCRSSSADPSRSSASICQRVHAGWRQSVRQKWRFGGCKRRVGPQPSVPGCSLAEGKDICRRCQTVLCLFCLHR